MSEFNSHEVPQSSLDRLIEEPRLVLAGRGVGWLKDAWQLYRESPFLWIGILIAYIVIVVVVGMLPLIGPVISSVIGQVFIGGMMVGCHSLDHRDGLKFGHLFAGFEKNFVQLALIGIFNLIATFLIMGLVGVLLLGGPFSEGVLGNVHRHSDQSLVLLGLLVGTTLMIPVMMAVWFAPVLVALHNISALQALKLSFKGCLRNWASFFIYSIVGLVLLVLATIPLGLGLLLLMPTLMCSIYTSYRDIFIEKELNENFN